MIPFPYPPCKEVHESLTELMEGSAPLHKRLLLRLHLAFCDACRPAYQVFLAIQRLSPRLLAPPVEPTPDAEDTLKAVQKCIQEGRAKDQTKN